MVGIRSPDGLVVGSCTNHPGVSGSIPKREEPGKTGRHPVLKYRVPHGSQDPPRPLWRGAGGGGVLAGTRRPSAAGTVCPLLYRYRLTNTYCSLARLPPTHPFVGAPILQRHFQVQWRARLSPPRVLLPHTCTQDGWFLQPKRRPARLPRRTVPSNCTCRCSRMRARLSPPRVLLPHTCTQDGWFLQPKRRPARLPRRTVPSNCTCRCSRMRARLSPPRVLLPHTCTQDGWFLQPKRRPARLPRRTVPSNCTCRCSRMRARLPLHMLLLHTQVFR
jgi:hypothetical protein